MKIKRKTRYRDGYLSILKEKPKLNDFNAKENATLFQELYSLPFEQLSARLQDIELMNILDKTLEIKVKTPNCGLDIDKKMSVVIHDDLTAIYSISHFDITKEEYFLYLTKVGGKKNAIIERTEKLS